MLPRRYFNIKEFEDGQANNGNLTYARQLSRSSSLNTDPDRNLVNLIQDEEMLKNDLNNLSRHDYNTHQSTQLNNSRNNYKVQQQPVQQQPVYNSRDNYNTYQNNSRDNYNTHQNNSRDNYNTHQNNSRDNYNIHQNNFRELSLNERIINELLNRISTLEGQVKIAEERLYECFSKNG